MIEYGPGNGQVLPPVAFNQDPASWGALASKAKGHEHVPAILCWTTEGPLRVVVHCIHCSKTETVKPNKRLRKIPWGFTEATWPLFLEKGKARDESIRQAAQGAN